MGEQPNVAPDGHRSPHVAPGGPWSSAEIGYAVLLAAGAALPFAQAVPWLAANGPDPALFLHDLFANRVSSFFGWDVVVAVVVLLFAVTVVDRRLSGAQRALAVLGSLLGASVGLPLYLLLRRRNQRLRPGSTP